jgi:tetratricopeptide (TPR) repeat protein
MRSSSLNSLSVYLNLNQLERVLREDISRYSKDRTLARMACTEFRDLARKYYAEGPDSCQYLLGNAATTMESFVSTSSAMPSRLVFDIHSLIGSIRIMQKQYAEAANSLTRALWIASSTKEVPTEELAVTLHRLAIAYGASNNYDHAKSLLQSSLIAYEKASVAKSHPCVVGAKSLIEALDRKQAKAEDKKSPLATARRKKRLSLVKETETPQRN